MVDRRMVARSTRSSTDSSTSSYKTTSLPQPSHHQHQLQRGGSTERGQPQPALAPTDSTPSRSGYSSSGYSRSEGGLGSSEDSRRTGLLRPGRDVSGEAARARGKASGRIGNGKAVRGGAVGGHGPPLSDEYEDENGEDDLMGSSSGVGTGVGLLGPMHSAAEEEDDDEEEGGVDAGRRAGAQSGPRGMAWGAGRGEDEERLVRERARRAMAAAHRRRAVGHPMVSMLPLDSVQSSGVKDPEGT